LESVIIYFILIVYANIIKKVIANADFLIFFINFFIAAILITINSQYLRYFCRKNQKNLLAL